MFGTDTPLHSLLIKPVQRIAKYPLLMKVRGFWVCPCNYSLVAWPSEGRGRVGGVC